MKDGKLLVRHIIASGRKGFTRSSASVPSSRSTTTTEVYETICDFAIGPKLRLSYHFSGTNMYNKGRWAQVKYEWSPNKWPY